MNRPIDAIRTLSVIALLFLFGGAIFMLTAAGGEGYARLTAHQEDTQSMRVAANYLTTQIRRFDTNGGVAVVQSPYGDCLVLSEEIDSTTYETRIYMVDGVLCERFVAAGAPFDAAYTFEITWLDNYAIALTNGMITAELSCGNETRTVNVYLLGGVQ